MASTCRYFDERSLPSSINSWKPSRGAIAVTYCNLFDRGEGARTPVRRLAPAAVIAAAVLVAGLVLPAAAAAATYYIATTGNDARSCFTAQNIRTPKRTVASGLTCLRAGDRLYLRGGTYPERIDSNTQLIPIGLSWAAAVTIAAYPGETVILQATSTPGVVNLANRNIQYLIFDGLVFDGGDIGSFGTSVISLWGGAHHVRFINAEIRNSPSQGITVFWGNGLSSDFNEFINCRVHGNGRTNGVDHGFYINTSSNLIENCLIYDNKAFGVHIYGETMGQPANDNVVRRNRLFNNGVTGQNGGGVVVSSGASTLVYNNLIYGNRDGVVVCCGARQQQILNNTIYRNLGYGVEVQVGAGHRVVNNILRLNAEEDTRFMVTVEASNNLTDDPLFLNVSADDFCLEPLSPAIDAGVTLDVVTTDFAGVPRPQGDSYDVGAIEFRAICVAP